MTSKLHVVFHFCWLYAIRAPFLVGIRVFPSLCGPRFLDWTAHVFFANHMLLTTSCKHIHEQCWCRDHGPHWVLPQTRKRSRQSPWQPSQPGKSRDIAEKQPSPWLEIRHRPVLLSLQYPTSTTSTTSATSTVLSTAFTLFSTSLCSSLFYLLKSSTVNISFASAPRIPTLPNALHVRVWMLEAFFDGKMFTHRLALHTSCFPNLWIPLAGLCVCVQIKDPKGIGLLRIRWIQGQV